MVDKNFFLKTRILDGGMGQELLNRGLKPRGTLWSAEALIKEEYHQLIIDTHLDFINSGAEIIVTNTFTSRKGRLIQNHCLEYFETIHDYQFRFPNYFRNQEKITKNTKLEDFYYEVYNENNCAYRISFFFN